MIGKAALAPILDASPELAERISEALAEQQLQIDGASSKPAAGEGDGERSGQLLGKIREFFSL